MKQLEILRAAPERHVVALDLKSRQRNTFCPTSAAISLPMQLDLI